MPHALTFEGEDRRKIYWKFCIERELGGGCLPRLAWLPRILGQEQVTRGEADAHHAWPDLDAAGVFVRQRQRRDADEEIGDAIALIIARGQRGAEVEGLRLRRGRCLHPVLEVSRKKELRTFGGQSRSIAEEGDGRSARATVLIQRGHVTGNADDQVVVIQAVEVAGHERPSVAITRAEAVAVR